MSTSEERDDERQGKVAVAIERAIEDKRPVDLSGVDISELDLRELYLPGAKFSGIITLTWFGNSNLQGSDFSSCIAIDRVDFFRADMRGVTWPRAECLQELMMDGAKISEKDVELLFPKLGSCEGLQVFSDTGEDVTQKYEHRLKAIRSLHPHNDMDAPERWN